MKKKLFVLTALLLAVFITGCGKTPDEELAGKVPASANGLCFIDGNYVVQTQLYRDNEKDIVKALKDASMPENLCRFRFLFFGSTKEEWGGALVQSADGQVRKFFDRVVAESKKDKSFGNMKESTEGRMHRVTGRVSGREVLVLLYHDDLMLIAVNRTDPVFFEASPVNSLFKEISLKGNIISTAVKVELPRQGKAKEAVDSVTQMVPSLKKLQALTMNVPFSADKPEVDFRMIFPDGAAANEMLAAINLGLGVLTQSGSKDAADIVGKLKRNVTENAVRISFPLTEVVNEIRKASQQSGVKAHKVTSASNLKQIGIGCKMFACDNSGKFPDDLTALVKGDYLPDVKVYIAPGDPRRKGFTDKIIRPANTSYAYVGKGLRDGAAAELPLAFEKPDVVGRNGGMCSVLFADGYVAAVKVKGRTCKAIAQELTAGAARKHAKEVALILANAAAPDQAE